MKGVTSDTAAILIENACSSKFEDKSDKSLDYEKSKDKSEKSPDKPAAYGWNGGWSIGKEGLGECTLIFNGIRFKNRLAAKPDLSKYTKVKAFYDMGTTFTLIVPKAALGGNFNPTKHKNTIKDFTNRNQSMEFMKLMVSLC